MKTLLVLLCLLVSFSARGAVAEDEHERLCARETHGAIGRWTPFVDHQLRGYVKEFLRRTEAREAQVVLCVNESPGATAWGILIHRTNDEVFVVGVGRRFLRGMGGHIRPIMAHEVGHLVLGVCPLGVREATDISCEHAVDRVAADWVGKSAMLAALRESVRILEWESANQPITYSGADVLKKRLRLLEVRE